MDAFFDIQLRSKWSYDSLKNFHQISPIVQTHLKQVLSGVTDKHFPGLEQSFGSPISLSIKSVLVAAFEGAALAFAYFSGAAMLAECREFLYLGGFI